MARSRGRPLPLAVRLVGKFGADVARRIVEARAHELFDIAKDLARHATLERHEIKLLAAADSLASLSGRRHQQVWDTSAIETSHGA